MNDYLSSLKLFVRVARPVGAGIPRVAGYRTGAGGYGVGAVMWGALSDAAPHVTDADIYAAVADVIPAGAVAWVRLGPILPDVPNMLPGATACVWDQSKWDEAIYA